ncbi:MAG: hypothetical protein PHO66_00975 [Eubacteriales bacterium]|nr:hypothetical protein [Eubacteriales bacterium]
MRRGGSRCAAADQILLALPTYRGHLPAAYFAFSERLEGFAQQKINFDDVLFCKANVLLIGNISAGADRALHEILSDFMGKPFGPESILLSSREYGKKSIAGDLTQDDRVRERLQKFSKDVLKRG